MSWVAAAVAGSAVVSGAMQSGAASDAAAQQVGAADRSTAVQQNQFDQTRADNTPFLKSGTAANKRLAQLLGLQSPTVSNAEIANLIRGTDQYRHISNLSDDELINQFKAHAGRYLTTGKDLAGTSMSPQQLSAIQSISDSLQQQAAPDSGVGGANGSLLSKFSSSDMAADPVYQSGLKFGLDRGTDAINARATQAGNYDSGATLKALTQFGNDYGSTKANESYNRFTNDQNNIFNRLSGVSGTGQVASNATASAGANMANNVSNTVEGAGNARAAGIVGGANAWGTAAGGINNAAQNYQSNQTLQALLKRYTSGGTPNSYDPSQYAG